MRDQSASGKPPSENLPDPAWRQAFRRRLHAWFGRHGRDLPWRQSDDPYAIWVSEIMLQQTQVATVKPYFARFLAAFPTIEALARADQRQVLRLWEGLGYYRRARQLHAAAQIIAEQHGGRFPSHAEVVSRLPGIGRYTAGAILSIAFDARLPILEANTQRLFSRLLAYRGAIDSPAGQRLLWALAEALLPRRGVGRFNQALMDLGSMVCTPRAPLCACCPVAVLCRANREQLQAEIPQPKRKPASEARHEVAVLVRRRGRVLVVQCPEGQRWAGLWDFPRFAVVAQHAEALARELIGLVRQRTGMVVRLGRHRATIKHGVTRFRITLDCYDAVWEKGDRHHLCEAPCGPFRQMAPVPFFPPMRWLRPQELEHYPLSTTGRQIGRLLLEG